MDLAQPSTLLLAGARTRRRRGGLSRSAALCGAAFALLASALAHAMTIQHETLGHVIARSQTAVVAEAIEPIAEDENPTTKRLSFGARIVRPVFGAPVAAAELRCVYEEGRPHRRGELAVAPLVSGSGGEFKVQPGDRVVLMLEQAPAGADDCIVLRIEPAASAARIARLKRGAVKAR